MSAKKTSTKRLSPNDRAKLIMEFENGKELSIPNYYVIKDKNGRVNVRRKKESSDSGSEEVKPKKATKPKEETTNPGPAKEYDDKPEKEEKPKAL